MLGSVDISAQPNKRTDKLDEAEKGAIQFVETREDAPKVLELIEAAFDQMSFAVHPGVVLPLELGRLMRWDHRFAALRVQVGDEVRPSIAAIRQHLREGQSLQERLRLGAVMALPGGQNRPQRIA